MIIIVIIIKTRSKQGDQNVSLFPITDTTTTTTTSKKKKTTTAAQGYDMEDAMILNKSAFERGFGNGSVYLNKWIDLSVYRKRGEDIARRFGILDRREAAGKLDIDGLP
jgi:DNA-directed RNA polymerase beta subunit